MTNELYENVLESEQEKKKRRIDRISKISMRITLTVVYVYVILHVLLLIIPFVWSFLTTFKSAREFKNNVFGLPQNWYFGNYVDAFSRLELTIINKELMKKVTVGFPMMLWNTFSYSATSAAVVIITQYIMAYATAKFDFKFNRVIDVIVIFTMTVPIYGSQGAELVLLDKLNMIDNFFMISVICKISFLGMYYFVIQSCIKGIPKAFQDAAEIDGANNFDVLFKIYFPLTLNIIVAIFVFHFIANWNDYQAPLLLLPTRPTIGYGLWKFKQSGGGIAAHVTMQFTGAWIAILPVMVIFIFLHDTLMGSISLSGGIKD